MKLGAISAIAALVFAAQAQAAEPIKIGLSGPFTGGSSSMGVSMRDGVKLAVDEINKKGGVLGRQIVLVERDDEAKNEVGAQISQELINKEATGTVIAEQFKQPDYDNNCVFRTSAYDTIQAGMMADEAVKTHGFKK